VEQQDGFGVTWAFVDVVHPQPVGQFGVLRAEGKSGKLGKRLVRCAEHVHGLSVPHRWRDGAGPDELAP
jgi:hypothetical protein